jgi:hypothetical protein
MDEAMTDVLPTVAVREKTTVPAGKSLAEELFNPSSVIVFSVVDISFRDNP